MKKPILCKLLGVAFTAALLTAPAVYAADKIDFDAIQLKPLVKEAPPCKAVPKEQQDAFNKAFNEAWKLFFHEKKLDEGAAKAKALIKDYAAYPQLVRRVRETLADQYYHSKEDHKKDALELYNVLVEDKGAVTRDTTRWLERKDELERKFKLYEDSLHTKLRLLAQPDVDTNQRFRIKMDIGNIIAYRLERYQEAIDLIFPFIEDTKYTTNQRVNAIFFVADLLRNRLKDPEGAIKLYERAFQFKDLDNWHRVQLTNNLFYLYIHLKPTPKLEEATALARKFYLDEKQDINQRRSVLYFALDRRNDLERDPEPLTFVDDAIAFITAHGKEFRDDYYNDFQYLLYRVLSRRDRKSDRTIAYLKGLAADERCTPRTRNDAARCVGRVYKELGQYDKIEPFLRTCFTAVTNEPARISWLLADLAPFRFEKGDLKGMLDLYQEAYKYNQSEEMTNLVVKLSGEAYEKFNQYKEAFDYYMAHNAKHLAAALCDSKNYADIPTAEKLYKEIIADEKAPLEGRHAAYRYLYKYPEYAERYLDVFLKGDSYQTNRVLQFLANKISHSDTCYAYYGDYKNLARTWELYEKLMPPKQAADYTRTEYAATAYAYYGQFERAASICTRTVTLHRWLKPEQKYELQMLADLLPRKDDVKKLPGAIAEADKRFAGEVPAKTRVECIERVGSVANIANREELVRALDAYKRSLYVPAPRKRYVVEYSEKPLLGIADWKDLAKKPVEAEMDRSYGGKMDFLVTDVSTGNRGTDIQGGKAEGKKPTLAIVSDVNGIHFRFEYFDDRARDIERHIIGGGSYEGYIAPGKNQPYICLLLDLQSGKLELWNTTYNSADHTRITEKDIDLYRTQTYYTDNSVVTYMMLSWDAYATLIPSDGTIWDFENVHWGHGNAAWNGTESIHGRSTWGELEFRMPAKARAQILRRLLFLAKANYRTERYTHSNKEGVIDHWKDEAIGDPVFYETSLKPLVDKLDGYAEMVTDEMTDEEVLKLSDEALPQWANFRFNVANMRAKYLADQIAK